MGAQKGKQKGKSNGALKIERGIPMPQKNNEKFPWRKMKVGDSFAIPDGTNIPSLAANSRHTTKRLGIKISIRKTYSGYRCWRVA